MWNEFAHPTHFCGSLSTLFQSGLPFSVVSAPLNSSTPHWSSKHSHASDFSPPSPASICIHLHPSASIWIHRNYRAVSFSANSAVYGNVRNSEHFDSLFKASLNSFRLTCFQKLSM
jgi:hypothetical protein